MSLGQVNSGFNLLGQGGAAAAARMAPLPDNSPAHEPIIIEPKLDVGWGDFHEGFASSIRALFSRPLLSKDFLGGEYFRDCWIERRIPKRAVFAAALWHVAIILMPFSLFTASLRHNPAFDNTQLTWSGPINDFPFLNIPAARPKPVSRNESSKPLAPKGADAFHPRQRIITDPVHPTHPRQTVINSAAPQLAPKTLPDLPNIVQLQAPPAPARPHVQISEEALANLHPHQRRVASVTATPPLDLPTLEQKPGEIPLVLATNAPARPKLELNAGAAPRVMEHAQAGDSAPAPELGAAQAASLDGSPASLIALSAAPAPPKPEVQPPAGNLAARVSISPEGTKRGVPDGSPSGAGEPTGSTGSGGKSPVGISISGGNPQPKNTVSGLGGARLKLPSTRSLMSGSDVGGKSEDAPERTGPPNFATLPPGAKPEQIFASKHVYTLAINMANINSASGSWILNFTELGSNGTVSAAADLASPVAMRKVDPKYPPELIEQNVQGDVVLYAIIRANGTVDSIQVVRSVDPQLDADAKNAFAQWKFTPASKGGMPVEIEVIAHIPFKIRDNR
jgi:TonB family protein